MGGQVEGDVAPLKAIRELGLLVDISLDELESGVRRPPIPPQRGLQEGQETCGQAVVADDVIPFLEKGIDQVASQEPSGAGNQHPHAFNTSLAVFQLYAERISCGRSRQGTAPCGT